MIIVVGGIKGGTGKSTIAFHLATNAFLNNKQIITYDCDFPQFSFSRYYENRKRNKTVSTWTEHNIIKDLTQLPEIINSMKKDMINIIDTPGRYDPAISHLHKIADIIITPINDSLMDIDTIMKIEQERWAQPGQYYEVVFENKKNNKDSLWLVVRNRSSSINSKHKQLIEEKLDDLSKRLNFTTMHGLKERNIFRELFANGMTVLDIKTNKMAISHLAAKMEIKMLWKKIEEYIKAK